MSQSDTPPQDGSQSNGTTEPPTEDLLSKKPSRRAEDIVEEFFEDARYCRWCLAKTRSFYPEYDRAKANRLHRGSDKGSNKLAFSASGYSINEDGSLQVNSATSDADPATYREVVEGAPKDGFGITPGHIRNRSRRYPPRAKTICHECSRIDIDPTEDRSRNELVGALNRLLDHMESDWRDYSIMTDREASLKMAHTLRDYKSMSGKDKLVLAKAIDYGDSIARNTDREE